MTLELKTLLDPVIKLAATAGERILAVYGTDFRVIKKQDTSPVTEADRLANTVIMEGLARLTPDIPAISEEGDHLPFSTRGQWRNVWLIDPLDGTREFIKRNGEFTVNIALVCDQVAVLGVVYAPATDTVYYATRGGGAFKRKGAQRSVSIHARAMIPSEPIVVTGSRSHNTGDTLQHFINLLGSTRYVPMGSALKSCVVAEGGADLYPRFGPTCEWDTAAAQCIVEEAGGGFTNLALQPLRYNARDTLLNPHFLVFGDKSYDWMAALKRADVNA